MTVLFYFFGRGEKSERKGGEEKEKEKKKNKHLSLSLSFPPSNALLTFLQGIREVCQGLVGEVGISGVEYLREGGGAGAERGDGGEEECCHGDDGREKEGGGARRRHFF